MEFNIYEEQIDGNGCFIKTLCGKTKEDVLRRFFKENEVPESAEWLYYAISKEQDEKDKRILKEAGCSSWDEYYDEMYPSRPIEI